MSPMGMNESTKEEKNLKPIRPTIQLCEQKLIESTPKANHPFI